MPLRLAPGRRADLGAGRAGPAPLGAAMGPHRARDSSCCTAARRTPTPSTRWPSRWRVPLLAVDLPGHGHSDAAPRGLGDVEGHARDVTAMLGALGIAHVPSSGMSLGGLVALLVAPNAPGVVSQLG